MRRILIQFDTDPVPSVFDRVVAVDAGIDQLFSYGDVTPEMVEPLVHGAIFTRGPADLKNTAIYVGGSDVEAGQQLFEKVKATFFGPLRVSVMVDSNGSNTTAAAAVLAARKHGSLRDRIALVLGGTGPVGVRAALLLVREGAHVRVGSRSLERAQAAATDVASSVSGAQVTGVRTASRDDLQAASADVEVLIAAGTAGAKMLSVAEREAIGTLKVAIDLNAVPPLGLEGIEVTDKGARRGSAFCYGAIGVGGTKMKIHKACLAKLFESNDQLLDTLAIHEIGQAITQTNPV
ncbi:MAG TPA: NAD(P)-dependent methylenetetrahydromethanopterin dehydrogenase [Planctomycetaceae bacterium]|nr:NAD(P)-dependent methylenetetrahydromethanopterin dehydrogenase [Planctomycetaceae bacterium]